MLSIVCNVIIVCLYVSLSLCGSEATVNIPENITLPAVIAFGDSFMDTGNNNDRATLVRANFLPYGKDFMGGKPTGRFTNGKTIPDYIVEKLGVKDYLPAYLDNSIQDNDLLTGVSFASGGSGFDPLTARILNVYSIWDQLEFFKEYIAKLKTFVGDEKANYIIGNSLYFVSWSSNDWAISYTAVPIRRLQYDVPAYANLLVRMATNFTREIHQLGARKVAYFNTPTIGCFPLARTVGGVLRKCEEKFNQEAQSFDNMLKPQIEFLGQTLPDSRFTVVDYYNIVENIIENAQRYGFEVLDRGCCGTGTVETTVLCNKLSPNDSKYLFWDSLHLTDKGYQIVVDHVLQNTTVDRLLQIRESD